MSTISGESELSSEDSDHEREWKFVMVRPVFNNAMTRVEQVVFYRVLVSGGEAPPHEAECDDRDDPDFGSFCMTLPHAFIFMYQFDRQGEIIAEYLESCNIPLTFYQWGIFEFQAKLEEDHARWAAEREALRNRVDSSEELTE